MTSMMKGELMMLSKPVGEMENGCSGDVSSPRVLHNNAQDGENILFAIHLVLCTSCDANIMMAMMAILIANLNGHGNAK